MYDIPAGAQIPVPKELGLRGLSTGQGESFCYEAIHTHDGTGILTLAVDEKNDMTLGRFLKAWWPEIWQKLSEALVLADGKRVEAPESLRITPNLDVKILFLPESGHHHAH